MAAGAIPPESDRVSGGSGFPWPPKPSAKAGSRDGLLAVAFLSISF
jgi:hypothetical protein